VIGSLGTTLLFDTGVYLTVAGMALLIIFSLMEE
jgi:multicomponent Na+:H+ antiporter subunit B